jgi:hypothetical protein
LVIEPRRKNWQHGAPTVVRHCTCKQDVATCVYCVLKKHCDVRVSKGPRVAVWSVCHSKRDAHLCGR